jgi:hypothetical protein
MSSNGKSVMEQKKEELRSAKGKGNDWKKWGLEFPIDILGWLLYFYVGFNSLNKLQAFTKDKDDDSDSQRGGQQPTIDKKKGISDLFPNVYSWRDFAKSESIEPKFETDSKTSSLLGALFNLDILKNTMYFNFYRIHQLYNWFSNYVKPEASPGMNMLIVFIFPIVLLSLFFVAMPINIFNFVYVLWETGNQYGWFPILVNILLFAFVGITFLALILSLFIGYTGLWTPGSSPIKILQDYLGNSKYNYFWSILFVIIAGPMYSASQTSLSSTYQKVFGGILAGLIVVVFGVALFSSNKSQPNQPNQLTKE